MFRKIVILYIVIGIFSGCAEMPVKKQPLEIIRSEKVNYPNVSFAVLSDVHLLDNSLFDEKSLKNLKFERKYVQKSEEILDAALNKIVEEKVNFLIISGDLTKDGEKTSHEKMAEYLGKLKQNGVNTFVIPGNHDVMNGNSRKYKGNKILRTENVTSTQFTEIYKDFGYGNAIEKDKESLSYVAEPVNGLWLLCIDSNKWKSNFPGFKPQNSGVVLPNTLVWIEEILQKAKDGNKAVIAVMHHGLTEHYKTNKKYYGDYLVENGDEISDVFAKYGVKIVFTGHFHAQDITEKKVDTTTKQKTIYDIETGSLVTWPAPYRRVDIAENKMRIKSVKIEKIQSDDNFEEHIKQFTLDSGFEMSFNTIKRFGIMRDEAKKIATAVSKAYVKNMGGDEDGKLEAPAVGELSFLADFALNARRDLVEGWSSDLYPNDNNIEIDLNND